MGVAVIQGASRGLGLQFCKHILKAKQEGIVYATCRDPSNALLLQELKKESGGDRLHIAKMDVTKENGIASVAKQVASNHNGIDLLVNCAGMLHPSGRGETSLKQVDMEGLHATFMLNSFGPLIITKHFAYLLQNGTGQFGTAVEGSTHKGVLVNLSAKVGSIGDNGLGGWYSYRMSKAALNMATKNLSLELGRGRSKVICVSLHPGTVDTDLSRPYHKGVPAAKLFSTEYSVNCMMDIINGLNYKETGKFFSWDGVELPW